MELFTERPAVYSASTVSISHSLLYTYLSGVRTHTAAQTSITSASFQIQIMTDRTHSLHYCNVEVVLVFAGQCDCKAVPWQKQLSLICPPIPLHHAEQLPHTIQCSVSPRIWGTKAETAIPNLSTHSSAPCGTTASHNTM